MRAISSLPPAEALKASAATANTDRRRFLGRKLVVAATDFALYRLVVRGTKLLFATLHKFCSRPIWACELQASWSLAFSTPQPGVHSGDEAVRFHLKILNGLRALPGVDHVTVSTERLGSGVSSNDGVLVDGRNPLPGQAFAPMRLNAVGS